MFKNLKALTEVEMKIQRAPKGVSRAQVKVLKELAKGGLDYRGRPSALLKELDETPLQDDMPWDEPKPPEFKF